MQVADFSLSSFLGQLESPIKSSQRSQAGEQIMEDARPSSDVSRNIYTGWPILIQSVFTEIIDDTTNVLDESRTISREMYFGYVFFLGGGAKKI